VACGKNPPTTVDLVGVLEILARRSRRPIYNSRNLVGVLETPYFMKRIIIYNSRNLVGVLEALLDFWYYTSTTVEI